MARESRVPQQERSARTRRQIADAARACFAADGYDRTQAKDIARTAGVSVGTFYEYFRDKADAFQTVLDDFYAAFEELELEGYLESGSGTERFMQLLGALQTWALSYGRLFTDFYTLAGSETSFDEPLERLERRIETRLAKALRRTMFAARPKRARDAARLSYTIVEAVLFRVLTEPGRTAAESLLREASVCLDAYVRAVAAE